MCPAFTTAQSTYLQLGSKNYDFINRLEIKQQTNTNLNFSAIKPFIRKAIVRETEFLDSARMGYPDSSGVDKYKEWTDLDLTPIDEYNMQGLLLNNEEWVSGPDNFFFSEHPFLRHFYKTKANFWEFKNSGLFVALNPVIQLSGSTAYGYRQSLFMNTYGISARGLIKKKIGFSSFIADNRERGPLFFQQRVNEFNGVPGAGFFKTLKNQVYHYVDARAYLTFNVI